MTPAASTAEVTSEATVAVFPRLLDLAYPNVERGAGVELFLTDGTEVLDACSGGAMVTCLGHGVSEVVDAAAVQAERLAYAYNHHFTNDAQERLAEQLIEVAARNSLGHALSRAARRRTETALRLARQYHVERGEMERWRVISPAQAYHGATMSALALSGRPALRRPFGEYLPTHLHIPPSTRRFDPERGGRARGDRPSARGGRPETVAAFFLRVGQRRRAPPTPPQHFWEGLAERRERHGFLICFDEIVTGMGRTGSWFAYHQLPLEPDIVTAGKGLVPATSRSRRCSAGNTSSRPWTRARERSTWGTPGTALRCPARWGSPCSASSPSGDSSSTSATAARGCSRSFKGELADSEIVGEVRGRGFLLGVDLVDPRDGESFLPDELEADELVDQTAFEHGLLVTSTHSTPDGYAGDATLLAPAFTSTDQELAEMVERLAATIGEVERQVKDALA